MYACTISFSSWMVVLNQLVSYSLVLHYNFIGLSVDFDNDRPVGWEREWRDCVKQTTLV